MANQKKLTVHIFSTLSLAILLYAIVNDWSYTTVFLPFLEGIITVAFLLIFLFLKSAKSAIEQKKYSYTPWIIVSLLLLCLAPIAFFGEPAINVLLRSLFFPLGGIGIPLGVVTSIVMPTVATLPQLLVALLLLIFPVLSLQIVVKDLFSSATSVSLDNYVLLNFLFPLLVLILGATLSFLHMQEQDIKQAKNNLSYQSGREIQEVLEEFYRSNGRFPESFGELVELKHYEQIPISPIENRVYTYTPDSDMQNYTVCFPRYSGKQCERSWSQ